MTLYNPVVVSILFSIILLYPQYTPSLLEAFEVVFDEKASPAVVSKQEPSQVELSL